MTTRTPRPAAQQAVPGARRLRVLFVDDEAPLREFMKTELPRLGHDVVACETGEAALQVLARATFDAAILDLRMPGISGLEVLEHLKKVSPDTEAVVMTGHASIETAKMAMRLGAAYYITKPCKLADIEALLERATNRRELVHKAMAFEERTKRAEGSSQMIGTSTAMEKVHQLLQMLAPTDATVLILGETGCGKELAARALWGMSKRSGMPFIPVNCGALPEHLVESELFGHVKGAFSGADRDHKGIFEVANGGTVFLDEVGELPKSVQVKLLRVLEAKEIRRVGDSKPFGTDVRVLCATHCDLRQMIRDDQFREDLYFRINTFEMRLPSLRERKEDIPDLARHLLARAARRSAEQAAGILSVEALRVLQAHDWPGNVRELANVMEYAFILSQGGRIGPEHLPPLERRQGGGQPQVIPNGPMTMEEVETRHLLETLERHGGNKTTAAAELGISLKTIYNKLNKLAQMRGAA
jgi:DNA-binding NtrC family response regulator